MGARRAAERPPWAGGRPPRGGGRRPAFAAKWGREVPGRSGRRPRAGRRGGGGALPGERRPGTPGPIFCCHGVDSPAWEIDMTKGHYRRYYNALQFLARQEKTASTASPRGAWRRVRREAGGPSGRPAVPPGTSPGGGCAGPVWGYGFGATGAATGALSGTGAEAAGVHERAEAPLPHPDGAAGQGAPTARRRRAESRIATHRDGSRLGTVPIPGGGVPVPGRASAPSALRRSPRFAGLCRPEVGVPLPACCLCSLSIASLAPLRGAVPTRGRRSLASASLRLVAWAPCASSASAWRLLRLGERSRV